MTLAEHRAVEARLPRASGPRVLATLIRQVGDFQLAEDAVQDAFAAAVADLAARRRAGQPGRLDHDRRAAARDRPPAPRPRARRPRRAPRRARRLGRARTRRRPTTAAPIADDRLRLIFTCCHPALAPAARVALTLRTLGGLTTARDRARVPRRRADDGAAARARQAQDRRRAHPVPGARRTRSCPTGCAACSASST